MMKAMMMMMRGKRRDLGSSGAWNGPASQKFHYIQLISFSSNALESTLHFIINLLYILSYNTHTLNISLQIYSFHPFHYRYTGHTLHFIMQHVWCNKLNFHSSKVLLPWRTWIENCFCVKVKIKSKNIVLHTTCTYKNMYNSGRKSIDEHTQSWKIIKPAPKCCCVLN